MKKERLELITYSKFACEVLKTKGAFLERKTPRNVRIQYRDDEETFVNVSCDDNLIVACRIPLHNCVNNAPSNILKKGFPDT